MALIYPVRDIHPQFGDRCWLADNATVTGDVVMGDDCSVWFQAVIRGDVNSIRIGDGTNIQDGAIIHGTYETAPTVIGSRVTIGHRAIVHGCTIHDEVLVGMGAIVMDHAVVEPHCIIAAGAVVLEDARLTPGHIYAGVPARKVKALPVEVIKKIMLETAEKYVMYKGWYGGMAV